ncbi:MAG TPA: tetratricopeptide repeat protein [Bryobacteraceae bacterium]|nr:tetratricopeptide repeat protein [Bryobacteraceae bacterium]
MPTANKKKAGPALPRIHHPKGGAVSASAPARKSRLVYLISAAAAVIVVFSIYSPALHGPFVFDDNDLPYALPSFYAPVAAWLRGPRPLLMLTYWVNNQISGGNTFSYHVANVLIHCLAGAFLFLILRRLLEWAGIADGRREWFAGFGAAVFWLHPMQTEAVAYIAGRSDGLSVMLFLAAFASFVYRRNAAVSWAEVCVLFLLFGAALLSKEQAIVLPALFLLTDYWWNPGFSFEGIRRNWKLYVPLAAGALAGFIIFLPLLRHGGNAGFGLKDFTWYQYFFTECRALFVYPAMLLLPVGQSADWNFAISKTIFDHGAIVGLIALVILAALAWRHRRRYRLASFGFFAYLLLMAPTSSIVPIKDAVAERRLYLSMMALLLIALDFLWRWKLTRTTLAVACCAIAVALAGATYARAGVWSSDLALWQDTVRSTPENWRAHFHLASAWYDAGRCDLAIEEYQAATQIQKPDYDLLVDWGLAYDCANQPEAALAKLRQAAALEKTAHVYSQIGMVYGKHAQYPQALEALATAEKLDPNFATTYVYKGLVHLALNQPEAAVQDYQRALALDPTYKPALSGLAQAQGRLQQRH